MSWTRLDYRRFANVIEGSWHIDDGDDVRWYITNHVADLLSGDDPGFNRETWLHHCGYDKQEDEDTKPERKQ